MVAGLGVPIFRVFTVYQNATFDVLQLFCEDMSTDIAKNFIIIRSAE